MLKYVYMLKYSKYLYKNIVSRKSFWATLLLSISTIVILGILHIVKVNSAEGNPLRSIGANDKFLPFILSSLLTALIVVFIFKSGQRDGTDLLVAAKPISRLKMIFSKFFVLALFIIAVQVLVFLSTFSYVHIEKFSSGMEMFKYSIALSVGGMIIQFIIASLVTFAALFISRVALIMITLLVTVTIPIVSSIIGPISYGGPVGISGINLQNTLIDEKYMENVTKEIEKAYSTLEKEDKASGGTNFSKISKERWIKAQGELDWYRGSYNGNMKIRSHQRVDIISSEKYLKERWYAKAAPFDIWYHWSSFYDQMLSFGQKSRQLWNPIKETINYDTKYSMNPITKANPKGDIFSKIFLSTRTSTIGFAGATLQNINVVYRRILGKNVKGTNITFAELFSKPEVSFYERMDSLMWDTQGVNRIRVDFLTSILYRKLVKHFKTLKGTSEYHKPNRIFPKPTNGEKDDKDGRFMRTDKSEALSTHAQTWFYVKGDKVEVWEPTPYVKQSTRIWMWASFVIGMFGLVVFIYYRKDFK